MNRNNNNSCINTINSDCLNSGKTDSPNLVEDLKQDSNTIDAIAIDPKNLKNEKFNHNNTSLQNRKFNSCDSSISFINHSQVKINDDGDNCLSHCIKCGKVCSPNKDNINKKQDSSLIENKASTKFNNNTSHQKNQSAIQRNNIKFHPNNCNTYSNKENFNRSKCLNYKFNCHNFSSSYVNQSEINDNSNGDHKENDINDYDSINAKISITNQNDFLDNKKKPITIMHSYIDNNKLTEEKKLVYPNDLSSENWQVHSNCQEKVISRNSSFRGRGNFPSHRGRGRGCCRGLCDRKKKPFHEPQKIPNNWAVFCFDDYYNITVNETKLDTFVNLMIKEGKEFGMIIEQPKKISVNLIQDIEDINKFFDELIYDPYICNLELIFIGIPDSKFLKICFLFSFLVLI